MPLSSPRALVVALTTGRMLVLHAIGVLAVAAAVLLGLWQLNAWQTGRELAARDLAQAPPVPLSRVISPDAPFPGDQVGRPVTFTGAWVPDGTLLVSDRRHDGHSGYWAVTPVAVCPHGDCPNAPAILVVRGWSPTAGDVPAPPTGRVTLTGWLQPGEGVGIPDPDPADDVLPELRIASAIQHVDQDLYGGYVIARESAATGDSAGGAVAALVPVTPDSLPKPDTTTRLRNLLYALEWWVFGGFAAFLWWRWVRDELDRRAAADQERTPAGIASSV